MVKGGRKEGESELRPTAFGLCDCVNTLSNVVGVPLKVTEALERLYITTDIGETIPVSNLVDDEKKPGCKWMTLHNGLVDIGFSLEANEPVSASLRHQIGKDWWMDYRFHRFHQNKAILSIINGESPAVLEVKPTVLFTDPISEGYIVSSPAELFKGKKFRVTKGEGTRAAVFFEEADNKKWLNERVEVRSDGSAFEFVYSVECLDAVKIYQHNRFIIRSVALGRGFNVELVKTVDRGESLSVALDLDWPDFETSAIIKRALFDPDALARRIGLKVEPKKLSAMILAS